MADETSVEVGQDTLPRTTNRRGRRSADGDEPKKSRYQPAVPRPAYIVFDPDNQEADGSLNVLLVTRKSEEVLNHLDQNRTHKYVKVMIK